MVVVFRSETHSNRGADLGIFNGGGGGGRRKIRCCDYCSVPDTHIYCPRHGSFKIRFFDIAVSR